MDERPASSDWLTAQQKYWDAWLDLTRQSLAFAVPGEAPGPAAEGLRRWWEAVAPAVPPPTQELFGRLVDLSRPYLEMAEQFADRTSEDSGAALDQWLDGLNQTFGATERSAASTSGPDAPAAAALWELPLDAWRQAVSALLPIPGDVLKSAKQADAVRVRVELKDKRDRLLSIPGIGYTRELQEQYQQLWRRVADYVEALQNYDLAFVRLGRRSIENFRKRLDAAAARAPIDSLRQLYDLWVDACEEVYVEYVLSDEYAALYGRLVNALSAVKQQSSVLLDDMLEGMNLPTRREIDTMHRRIHETRRENRTLRADLERLNERLERSGTASSTDSKPHRKTKHH